MMDISNEFEKRARASGKKITEELKLIGQQMSKTIKQEFKLRGEAQNKTIELELIKRGAEEAVALKEELEERGRSLNATITKEFEEKVQEEKRKIKEEYVERRKILEKEGQDLCTDMIDMACKNVIEGSESDEFCEEFFCFTSELEDGARLKRQNHHLYGSFYQKVRG